MLQKDHLNDLVLTYNLAEKFEKPSSPEHVREVKFINGGNKIHGITHSMDQKKDKGNTNRDDMQEHP